jgi:hypothetical protein
MADSVFGELGGSGKQSADGDTIPGPDQTGARNMYGLPTGNPSGGHGPMPAQDSVFGDLGGGGVDCQLTGTTAPEPGSGDFPAY